jgi:hypothetical protein
MITIAHCQNLTPDEPSQLAAELLLSPDVGGMFLETDLMISQPAIFEALADISPLEAIALAEQICGLLKTRLEGAQPSDGCNWGGDPSNWNWEAA